MEKIKIGKNGLEGSGLILGCMRIDKLETRQIEELVETAMGLGINYIDLSDYYKLGLCEEKFGKALALHPEWRENLIIQDKFGICPNEEKTGIGYFDFSEKHLLEAVDNSLRLLHTDHLDVMLLHRPDTLFEPEEVASAFEKLYKSGKALNFGVSNHTPAQIELLKKYSPVPIVIDQLQLSILECPMIGSGLNMNLGNDLAVERTGGVLEYMRMNDITLQAWSPFQIGFFEGCFLDNPDYPELNAALKEYADKFGVSKSAVAAAWIMRHPVKSQVLVGTTNAEHLRQAAEYEKVRLERRDWYALYKAAGHILP
ncbi:MAG: aldo/keto reductase [Clostridia bacterium]|nr:aldo/keto reductase [Clostridia bacterium]